MPGGSDYSLKLVRLYLLPEERHDDEDADRPEQHDAQRVVALVPVTPKIETRFDC